MVDGIIQQVFKKWKQDYPPDQQFLDSLQQELIEKIKQEIEQYNNNFANQILKKLIGDNKDGM